MHTLDYLDGYFSMSRLIASGFLTWKCRQPKVDHGALASFMQPQIFRKACNVKELNNGHMYMHRLGLYSRDSSYVEAKFHKMCELHMNSRCC
jgi:hypothetical protein